MTALPDRLYRSYLAHAGAADPSAIALVYRRDIRPHLPAAGRVLDIGCGQGELVRQLHRDGFDAYGVDISPDQVRAAQAAGVSQVVCADLHDHLRDTSEAWDAVVATDVLEHMTTEEAVAVCDRVRQALRPGGVLVARVPNAVSPLGGHTRYGDLTHQSWFTDRSVAQLAAATGFAPPRVLPCPPVVHGPASAARWLLWRPVSGLFKLALAAETGLLRGHIVTQNLTFVARRGSGG